MSCLCLDEPDETRASHSVGRHHHGPEQVVDGAEGFDEFLLEDGVTLELIWRG